MKSEDQKAKSRPPLRLEPREEAFCKKLTDESEATGSERDPNSHFPFPHGAGQKQVGNIGTSNEQDKADDSQEHEQSRAHFSHNLLFQRNHVGTSFGIGFGERLLQDAGR